MDYTGMPFDLKFSHKNPLLANWGGVCGSSCILALLSVVITAGDRPCLQDRQCDNAT